MTQGCRWNEKRFSVAVKNKLIFYCAKCRKELQDVSFTYNGDPLCQDCFSKMPVKTTWGETPQFYTTKDKLFEFQTAWGHEVVNITSKGQWKRFMKKHNIHDDCKQGWRKEKDYLKPKEPKLERGWAKNQILSELQEKGLRGKLIRKRR